MSSGSLDGRFTMKGPLRCAGVGSLMCAEDKDGARTAIRLIPQAAQGKEAVAAALKLPQHPVLPRALGSGAMEDSSWVAIDFPEGELLTHRIPLDTPSLLTMGSMIAGALTALHQNDIVHGELSTESVLTVPGAGGDRFILFDAPLVVMNRLSDRRGEERLLVQLIHLVTFLSPERARGMEASMPSDIWSLGMILSLASGAEGIPGRSTLEKIAAVVTNKWRPAVSQSLPIALRLLLTRMLAPDPKDRPSSLDVAMELEHLCVALAAHQQVKPHVPPAVETLPQSKLDKLLEKSKAVDPFEALVAGGVSVNAMDSHSEPTREMVIADRPGHDKTDPYAMMPAPVPTAPDRPVFVEPPVREVAAPLALLIPAHPSTRPLPPILDPAAVIVPAQPMRPHSPTPMPKLPPSVESLPGQSQITGRFGMLPGAVRPEKVPAVLTEDVAEEAAAARAAFAMDSQSTGPAPIVSAPAPVRSIHDDAEDAFAADVLRAQKKRYQLAAIAACVVIVGAGGMLLRSALLSSPEHTPVVEPQQMVVEDVKPAPAPAPIAVAAPEPVVAAKPPTPVVKPEPVAAPVATKPAETDELQALTPKPAPKPKPAAAKKPVEEAPRKPVRLDDD